MPNQPPSWALFDPLQDRWTLHVQIQPGARISGIAGEHDGRLKLKIAAPPVDNKANHALIDYVASLAGVSPRKVEILHGGRARRKTLAVNGTGVAFLHFLEQQQKTGKS